MTKAYSKRKLCRPVSHRVALLRNLSTALIMNEKIKTTVPKAEELKKFLENIITIAKSGKEKSYRKIQKDINNKEAIKKLFDVIVPRYNERKGGYIQVFRIGTRKGDSAPMALVRLIQ